MVHLTLRLNWRVLASVPVSGLQSSPGQSNSRGSAVRGRRPRRWERTSSCMMLVFWYMWTFSMAMEGMSDNRILRRALTIAGS